MSNIIAEWWKQFRTFRGPTLGTVKPWWDQGILNHILQKIETFDDIIEDSPNYEDEIKALITGAYKFSRLTGYWKRAEDVSRKIASLNDKDYLLPLINEALRDYKTEDKTILKAVVVRLIKDIEEAEYAAEVDRRVESWSRATQVVRKRADEATKKAWKNEDLDYTTKYKMPIERIGSIEKAQNIINRFKQFLQKNAVKTALEFVKEIAMYSTSIGMFETLNALATTGPPFIRYTFPAMFGYLPIPHCQEIEVARSGQVLKFRATGSIFLANQKGADDAIRIEFLLLPEEATIMILMLWSLFHYCRGDTQEIKATGTPSLVEIRSMARNLVVNTNKVTPTHTFHRTLPLITNHIIIPRVYIETFSFEDLDSIGKDVIKCSILLRTYEKPKKFERYQTSTGQSMIGMKVDKTSKMFNMMEFAINTVYRMTKHNFLVADSQWKINKGDIFGNILTDQEDVYYNISAGDIAATTILSSFGVMGLKL